MYISSPLIVCSSVQAHVILLVPLSPLSFLVLSTFVELEDVDISRGTNEVTTLLTYGVRVTDDDSFSARHVTRPTG